jgi:hypothetical protein
MPRTKAARKRVTTIAEDNQSNDTSYRLLQGMLAVLVPKCIDEWLRWGGPQREDFAALQAESETLFDEPWWMPGCGLPKGEPARRMAKLARTIAAMSFVPGGITAWDLHFETQKEGTA